MPHLQLKFNIESEHVNLRRASKCGVKNSIIFVFPISFHQRVVELWTLDPAENDAFLADELTKELNFKHSSYGFRNFNKEQSTNQCYSLATVKMDSEITPTRYAFKLSMTPIRYLRT